MTDGDRQHDKDNDLSKGPGVCLCVCVFLLNLCLYRDVELDKSTDYLKPDLLCSFTLRLC